MANEVKILGHTKKNRGSQDCLVIVNEAICNIEVSFVRGKVESYETYSQLSLLG